MAPTRRVERRCASLRPCHESHHSAGFLGGSKGKPLASPKVLLGVGWLDHRSVTQVSPAAGGEPLSRATRVRLTAAGHGQPHPLAGHTLAGRMPCRIFPCDPDPPVLHTDDE